MHDAAQQAPITIYTLPWCGHCARARALLARCGLVYREVDMAGTPRLRQRLMDLTGGFTVPQVVIDGEPIGGADELARLDRAGVLAALAQRDPFPIERDQKKVTPRSLARWAAARIHRRRDVSPVQRRRVLLDRHGRVVAGDESFSTADHSDQ